MEGTEIDPVCTGSFARGLIENLRAAARWLGGDRAAGTVRGISSAAKPGVFQQTLPEATIRTCSLASPSGPKSMKKADSHFRKSALLIA
jgi:hypothetical protein